jgi:hypothetical protein
VPEDVLLEHRETLGKGGPALTVVASVTTPRRVLDALKTRQGGLTYEFTAAKDDGFPTAALIAASLGAPVRLAPTTEWPREVLLELARYFLYSPTLETPIEPFATLARSMAELQGLTLTWPYLEILGRCFYVDKEERVTLSPRWAEAGRFFGTTRDDLETLQASELWRELAALRMRTFSEGTPCATCAHYPWCGGFWLALESDPARCEPWKDAMDLLYEAWQAQQQEAGTESA